MIRLRPVWTTSLALLGIVGAAVAVMSSPASALWAFCMPGIVIGFVAANFDTQSDGTQPDDKQPGRGLTLGERVRQGFRYGAAGGLYVVALTGLSRIVPVPLLLLLLAGSLGLLILGVLAGRRQPEFPPVPDTAADLDDTPLDLGTVDASTLDTGERRLFHARTHARALSTPRLCEAWSASFAELQRCTDTASRAWITTRRQIYLDELERRDPEAVHAWLDADARAASNPGTFLHRHEGGRR